MRRTIATILVGIAAVLLPFAGQAHAATAADASSMEQQFVAKINALRTSKGLRPLTVDAQLTSIGRQWAAHMAQAGAISHNPNLGSQVTENWVKLGENVGEGPDVDSIWNAFVASPHHYTNLVDPAFTHVGVGVVVSADGTIWTSHEFMQLAAAPAPAPAAAPRPAPAPRTAPRPAVAVTAPVPAPAAPVAAPAPAPVPAPVQTITVSAGPDHVVQSMEQLRTFGR